MSSIRINISTALITLLVVISVFEPQHGAFAIEQKNTTDAKPDTPLSSIAPSTSIPIVSSSSSPASLSTTAISQPHNTARDEIYIDDEGLEGSGRGEIHDDLEKEPEYSGSGFGPDDEDSTSHPRKPTQHKPSKTKSHVEHQPIDKNKQQSQEKYPHHIHTDTEEEDFDGSGDRTDDNDNDNDNDDDLIVPTNKDKNVDGSSGRDGILSNKPNININVDEEDLTTEIEENTDVISIDKTRIETDNISSGEGNEIDLDQNNSGISSATGKPDTDIDRSHTPTGNEVFIMDKSEDRTTSFFAQPGILAAVIGGAVVGLLCAILVVMFIVYRMRKKDEGSYALDEPKRSPAVNSYAKNANNREFYAWDDYSIDSNDGL